MKKLILAALLAVFAGLIRMDEPCTAQKETESHGNIYEKSHLQERADYYEQVPFALR